MLTCVLFFAPFGWLLRSRQRWQQQEDDDTLETHSTQVGRACLRPVCGCVVQIVTHRESYLAVDTPKTPLIRSACKDKQTKRDKRCPGQFVTNYRAGEHFPIPPSWSGCLIGIAFCFLEHLISDKHTLVSIRRLSHSTNRHLIYVHVHPDHYNIL